MDALMRHYKAVGFSDEVSRLAASPKRPSTNRMYGKAKVVMHQTISDVIVSMELQRPRVTIFFPQWDLGIVLEALSKPHCKPLREASFKHLTLKTVFLLAMASAERHSELQVLRFDQNYIQFKPKGAGVTLYLSPEFMRKNQKPNQVNDPWYIHAVPTGNSEFCAPNCPVRALRYYHRHLTEHPELMKDKRCIFVAIKDNNAGKELSASTISRWICTTIVDSHALESLFMCLFRLFFSGNLAVSFLP